MRTVVAAAGVLVLLAAQLGEGSTAEAQGTGLTEALLRNATYPSEFSPSRQVVLRDGRYEWNQPPLRGYAMFAQAVIGPEFAAVLIDSSTGGSGMFMSLHLVTSTAGAVSAGPGLLVGDRQRVEAFAIEDGRVRLALLTQGPTDPFCCPTQRETRTYVREGNAFRLAATVITQPGSGPLTPPRTGQLGTAAPGGSAVPMVLVSLLAVALVAAARGATRRA
jgi:hypothetical protein